MSGSSKRQVAATREHSPGSKTTVTAQEVTTDAPLIPVSEVERLYALNPEFAQFVFDQTKREAEHRRSIQIEALNSRNRVHRYIFVERFLGICAALSIGAIGLFVGAYVILQGHDWAGASIAAAAMGSLAVAFLNKKNKPEQKD